nr:leucine-rich repeat protein [Tanacetum cinerariifolium]
MTQTPPRNHAPKGYHKHYARMSLPNLQRHVVSTAVITKSKLVHINVVRPVTVAVPKLTVTRPRQAKIVVTKPTSSSRRHINHSPSPKDSNFSPKVTAVKVPQGNPQHALKDKRVIDSGCSRHMIGNMSYLFDFEELNGGYVAFGGNPKGGKFSGKGNDFKALVYEFMPNGSVHDWLHSSANTSKLNLLQRINILKDVATALDYLHNRCQTTIVHGDLKPSNILLDDDMVAHVGDFGLARLLGTDLNQNSSTGVRGTIGYAPPEYGIGNQMTSSGDVYSFGILLLEVMSGKKPIDGMFNEGLSLHKFAYMALPDYVIDVIDNDAIVLQSTEANAKKVEECLIASIKIGVSCSLDSPPQRMKIEIVVIELQHILDVLQNI